MNSHQARPAAEIHRKAKAADLASSLGAIALGAGLALMAHEVIEPHALHLLASGLIVHGGGMTLKHRWEKEQREPRWWEQALFWLCWLLLAALAILIVGRTGASGSA